MAGLWRIKYPQLHNEAVSIVVAARNEKNNLEKLVPVLFNQVHQEYEVIIALNETNDGSYEFLLDLKKTYQNLSVINIDHIPAGVNAKKYALTAAIKSSKFDIILLTDADCLPVSNHWVSEMTNGFYGDKSIVVGYSPYNRSSGWIDLFTQYDTRLTGIQYLSSAQNGHPYMGVGRNLAYRKSFFLNKNGFNGYQHITGGDDDLFVNKNATSENTTVLFSLESFVITNPETSLSSYYNQKVRHISVGKYYGIKSKFFLGLFSLTHIGIWLLCFLQVFLTKELTTISLIFSISYIPFLWSFAIFNKKSGSNFALPFIILIDVVFSFFYIFVGIHAMFTKRIEWTN